MATSKPSTKNSSSLAPRSPNGQPHGTLSRRTAKPSVIPTTSSPEHHAQAARKPLARTASDTTSRLSRSTQQAQPSATTAATKRQPIRKPLVRSTSLEGTVSHTAVKERVPLKTGPGIVVRPAISPKPGTDRGTVSKATTRTERPQPVASKARSNAGVMTKEKEATAVKTVNKTQKPAGILSEHRNVETGPDTEGQCSPFSFQLTDEKLDDIGPDELDKLEPIELEHHASSILDAGDKNAVDSNNLSNNAVEKTEEHNVEQNSVEIVEDKAELLVQPSCETSDKTTEIEKESVGSVNGRGDEGFATISAMWRRSEVVVGMRTESPKSNEMIEETRNKLLEHRKSKVKALVGAFENVMS